MKIKKWILHIVLAVLVVAVFFVYFRMTKPRIDRINELKGYSRQLKNNVASTASALGAMRTSNGVSDVSLFDDSRQKTDIGYIESFFEKTFTWFSEKQASDLVADLQKHGQLSDDRTSILLYDAANASFFPEGRKMSSPVVNNIIPVGASNGVYSYEADITVAVTYKDRVADADLMVFCDVDENGRVSNFSANLVSMEERS